VLLASLSPPLVRCRSIPNNITSRPLESLAQSICTDIDLSGSLAASFGVAAGTFALFFFGDIPRVNRDVIRQVPWLDAYYDKPVAPEDNVSCAPIVFLEPDANTVSALLNDLGVYLDDYVERPTFETRGFPSVD